MTHSLTVPSFAWMWTVKGSNTWPSMQEVDGPLPIEAFAEDHAYAAG